MREYAHSLIIALFVLGIGANPDRSFPTNMEQVASSETSRDWVNLEKNIERLDERFASLNSGMCGRKDRRRKVEVISLEISDIRDRYYRVAPIAQDRNADIILREPYHCHPSADRNFENMIKRMRSDIKSYRSTLAQLIMNQR